MEGAERVTREQLPEIERIEVVEAHALGRIRRGERRAEIDLTTLGRGAAMSAEEAQRDEWGHHLVWPRGEEVGADALRLASLTARGEEDARALMEWRFRHALTASRAAEALGVRKAEVVAWSTGGRRVPRAIMRACRGWESRLQAA